MSAGAAADGGAARLRRCRAAGVEQQLQQGGEPGGDPAGQAQAGGPQHEPAAAPPAAHPAPLPVGKTGTGSESLEQEVLLL